MVKPRPDKKRHPSTTNPRIGTPPAQGSPDLAWLWPAAQLGVAALMLVFVVELLISAWPFILIGLILFFILAG